MAINKLVVAGGLAVAGLGGLGAVHFASAQGTTPNPTTQSLQVQSATGAATAKGSESMTELNDQIESKSTKDGDNVTDQQGSQGVDNNKGTETETETGSSSN